MTLCPIRLLPYPAASLYSRTRKNWLTLTFHSLFHYSNHLSSPPHPWKSSYQGPSATPNAMGISLSSCILTSYCILTQVFTFTFLNHFFLSALIVLPSIPIPTHFFFYTQLLIIEAQEIFNLLSSQTPLPTPAPPTPQILARRMVLNALYSLMTSIFLSPALTSPLSSGPINTII